MPIGLKDIAKKTGYSVTTVSRVLNHKGDISSKTREEVLSIAEKMGYHENRLVNGFLTGKTNTVGLILDWTNAFFNAVGCAAMESLMSHGILPVTPLPIGYSKNNGNTDQQLIHRLLEQRVDGIIVMLRNDLADDAYFRDIAVKSVPVITIDRKTRISADFVGSDDFAGGRMAAEHLYSIGRRNIGYIAGPDYASPARLRRQGMEAFSNEHPDMKIRCITANSSYNFEDSLFDSFFNSHPETDAVAAFYDRQAISVGRYLKKKGYRIPEDIALLGFGNLASDSSELLTLSTIDQHPDEIGKKAVERLLLRMNSDTPILPEDFRIMPTLKIGETTAI